MEWYLQTRTNTPINYKTILLLQTPRAPTGPPQGRDPRRRDVVPASPAPSASSIPNFWSPAFSCNLEEDRGRPPLSPPSPCPPLPPPLPPASSLAARFLPEAPQIFDTQNPVWKRTTNLRSVRESRGRRPSRCEIQLLRGGCGKLMWRGTKKTARACGILPTCTNAGAGAIRRKQAAVRKWITEKD